MAAIVAAIQTAAPVTAEQMEQLGQWDKLSNAEVAALTAAMGIPPETQCAPTIIGSFDPDTLEEVGREVKDVQIKPFDAGDGNFVHITVHPTESGPKRTEVFVEGTVVNGGLTPEQVEERMAW